MNKNSWQYKLYKLAAENGPVIKNLFFFSYMFLVAFLAFGIYTIVSALPIEPIVYRVGKNFGRLALVLLGLVVTPGILGRFGIEIPVTRIVTAYRRQIGILVFLLALNHYFIVRMTYRIIGVLPLKLPLPMFEVMGLAAFTIFFLMFLTSNNFSVKKLGKFWKKMHRFIYLALWLLVLHTGLQKISVWTVYAFFFASLEIISFIYARSKKSNGA